MQNKFYNDFDKQRLDQPLKKDDYRSEFQVDRDRIIHSSEFRRLQGKTQVFLPGEYDFYRTRLTHSIEVAQIGRSICNYLNKRETDKLGEDFHIDSDLVEASCLAHDLGHPPFGHAGERTLNQLMRPFGGFEGNAQTLRLITEILYRSETGRRGMNPTRAFVDSILKYKSLFKHFFKPENHFLYDYQEKYINFVFEGFDMFNLFTPGKELNSFRSIECMIMDWADDTAYAVNDLVDSISGGFITIEKLHTWQRINEDSISLTEMKYLDEMLNWIKSGKYKAKFGSQIGDFINSCKLVERDTPLNTKTNRYKYALEVDDEINNKADFYKRISVELVFHAPQLHQMEFKGKQMLGNIFDVINTNYIQDEGMKLLPDFTGDIILKADNEMERARLSCDYIAGMTDVYAMRTYRRLFDPEYSSIVDLISLKE